MTEGHGLLLWKPCKNSKSINKNTALNSYALVETKIGFQMDIHGPN